MVLVWMHDFCCWQVPYTDDGMEAIVFTAQGDMRQVCACVKERGYRQAKTNFLLT